jgi:hypothetical protein
LVDLRLLLWRLPASECVVARNKGGGHAWLGVGVWGRGGMPSQR